MCPSRAADRDHRFVEQQDPRRALAALAVTVATVVVASVTGQRRLPPRTTQCIDISQTQGHLVTRLLGARDDLQHLGARGGQSMVWPPLTVRRSPVMKRAASLATKATTSAMSSGRPSRPSGTSRT